MGVPTSEVGYTPAMPKREDHEVHKGHGVALDKKKCWSTKSCVVSTPAYTWAEVLIHLQDYPLPTQSLSFLHKYGLQTAIFWWQLTH